MKQIFRIVVIILIALSTLFAALCIHSVTGNASMRLGITSADLLKVEGTQRIIVPLVPVESTPTANVPEEIPVKLTMWERITNRFKNFKDLFR